MYHFSVLGLTLIIAEQTRRVKNEMYYLFLFIGCVKCFIPLKNIELGNCGKMDVDLENFNAQSQSAGVNSIKKMSFEFNTYLRVRRIVWCKMVATCLNLLLIL